MNEFKELHDEEVNGILAAPGCVEQAELERIIEQKWKDEETKEYVWDIIRNIPKHGTDAYAADVKISSSNNSVTAIVEMYCTLMTWEYIKALNDVDKFGHVDIVPGQNPKPRHLTILIEVIQ